MRENVHVGKSDRTLKRSRYFAFILVALLMFGVLRPVMPAGASSEDIGRSAEQCFAVSDSAVFYVRGFGENGTLRSTGSGFVVSKNGTAVTAAHVVQSMVRVTVLLGENELEAQVISCNSETDTAVLKLPDGSYDFLKVAEKSPETGALVRAMGYPM